jgi:ribose transport system substrate-binding protein
MPRMRQMYWTAFVALVTLVASGCEEPLRTTALRGQSEGRCCMSRRSVSTALVLLASGMLVASCGDTDESAPAERASANQKFSALYDEVSKLQGEEALKYFESLPSKGVTGTEVIEFFIDLPISDANPQIHELFEKEGFERYLDGYPRGEPHDAFQWKQGSGTEIAGPFSKQSLKLPFTDYVSLPEGPVGNPDETYDIGVTFHGFDHPWLINWADAARWEAERHPNVNVKVLDAQYDNNKMASHFDTFVSQQVDGILVWPMVEAPTGPPAQRAVAAGIPVVSVDRLTGFKDVTSRVSGNFPANGAQVGMALIDKLAKEGDLDAKMVMLRKPLGSTADAVRTGHMLKVLSYFPGIEILKSYHDTDNREEAYANAQAALQAYRDIDVFFGTGDHEALAAWEATKLADRLNSRAGGKKIIFLSIDDSKEALTQVKKGNFEVNTPYTPLISDIGMRVLLNAVAGGEKMPRDVITPNIPMVTPKGAKIFGLETQTPDQWWEYTFGPPL